MRDNISNIAVVSGTYNSKKIDITSNEIIVPLNGGLTINKTADKTIWVNGILTFLVEINNSSNQTYKSVIFDDEINPAIAHLIDNTFTINNQTVPYSYNSTTGILIADIGDINPNEKLIIRFQVQKLKNTWNRLNNEATITWDDTFSSFLKSRVCIVLNGTNYPIYNGNCKKRIGYLYC